MARPSTSASGRPRCCANRSCSAMSTAARAAGAFGSRRLSSRHRAGSVRASRPGSQARFSSARAARQASARLARDVRLGRGGSDAREAVVRFDPNDDVFDRVDRPKGDLVGSRQRRTLRPGWRRSGSSRGSLGGDEAPEGWHEAAHAFFERQGDRNPKATVELGAAISEAPPGSSPCRSGQAPVFARRAARISSISSSIGGMSSPSFSKPSKNRRPGACWSTTPLAPPARISSDPQGPEGLRRADWPSIRMRSGSSARAQETIACSSSPVTKSFGSASKIDAEGRSLQPAGLAGRRSTRRPGPAPRRPRPACGVVVRLPSAQSVPRTATRGVSSARVSPVQK